MWSQPPVSSLSNIFLSRQNRIFFASILRDKNFSRFKMLFRMYYFTFRGKYPWQETYSVIINHSRCFVNQSDIRLLPDSPVPGLTHATFPVFSTRNTFSRAYHLLLDFPRPPPVTCFPALVNVNVICLPTEHQGVHKNSFRNVPAFQIELEFGNVGF